MKKNLFLTIVILSTVLLSCKKESNDSLPDPTVMDIKVKTVISIHGTTTYKYDVTGRRTQVINGVGARSDYEYLNGIIYEKGYNAAGVLGRITQYELNSDGLVVKETADNDPDYSNTFVYNSDKQVVKRILANNGNITVSDLFYSNGNCDSIRFSYNGSWSYSEKTTYYTDQTNVMSHDTFGASFFGKSSKNLLKTVQNIYPNGTATGVVTALHEMDSKGRVIKETNTLNGNIEITYYTY